uniref:Uncharacterized protein n=1 Tax=Opuntia streptacantha TaxID=393608 RepID=A0A7C9EW79_OPUST
MRLTKFLWFTFDKVSIFFLNCLSKFLDQPLADVTGRDITAISIPLESVPLYIFPKEDGPMMLLKSSQAVSSSAFFKLGIPSTKLRLSPKNPSDLSMPVTKAF